MDSKAILQEWLDSRGWDDELIVSDDGTEVSLRTGIELDENSWNLFVDANNQSCLVGFFLYSSFKVKTAKRAEACLLVNEINDRMRLGRFVVRDNGQIQYRQQVDFEAAEPTSRSMELMAVPAFSFCETYNSTLAAVALTKQTAADAIAEFDAVQAEKAAAAASEDAEDDESDGAADDAPRMM